MADGISYPTPHEISICFSLLIGLQFISFYGSPIQIIILFFWFKVQTNPIQYLWYDIVFFINFANLHMTSLAGERNLKDKPKVEVYLFLKRLNCVGCGKNIYIMALKPCKISETSQLN